MEDYNREVARADRAEARLAAVEAVCAKSDLTAPMSRTDPESVLVDAIRAAATSVPAVDAGDREPASEDRKPRLRACVEAWPDCVEGEYDPHCCRFPKSCSCTVYDPNRVGAEDLEPASEVQP